LRIEREEKKGGGVGRKKILSRTKRKEGREGGKKGEGKEGGREGGRAGRREQQAQVQGTCPRS
jgi:hypothetical protein